MAFVIVSLGDHRAAADAARPAAAVPDAVGAVAAGAVGGRELRPDARPAAARTWERLIIWMAIGVAVYFVYGYRHSRLGGGGSGV